MAKLLKVDFSLVIQRVLIALFVIILFTSLILLINSSSSDYLGTSPDNLFRGYVSNIKLTLGANLPENYPQKNIFTQSFDILTTPIMAIVFILVAIYLLKNRFLLFFPFGLIGSLILLLYNTALTEIPFDELVKVWIIFLMLATAFLIVKSFFKTLVNDEVKKILFLPQLSLILLIIAGVYLFIVFYSLGALSFIILQMSFPDAKYLMQISDPNRILVIGTYEKDKKEYKISNPFSNTNPFNTNDSIILKP